MKKHKTLHTICACICILLLTASAYFVAKIISLYNIWSYENQTYYLSLPEITKPTYTEIDIIYVGKKPTDIKISDTNSGKGVLFDVNEIEEEKKIIVSFDTNKESNGYTLELKPQDNYELQYHILQEDSRNYIAYDIEYFMKKDKKMIRLNASYKDEPVYATVFISDASKNFSKPSDVYEVKNNSITLNISKMIAEAKDIPEEDLKIELSIYLKDDKGATSKKAQAVHAALDMNAWEESTNDTPTATTTDAD